MSSPGMEETSYHEMPLLSVIKNGILLYSVFSPARIQVDSEMTATALTEQLSLNMQPGRGESSHKNSLSQQEAKASVRNQTDI